MRKLGFTLIELLVVMSIMGLLASMIFAMIGGADKKNAELETNLLISRLVAALGQFENLTGDIALPTGDRSNAESGSWYPAAEDGSWENQQLWWRISTEMSDENRKKAEEYALVQDIAADPYQSEDYIKKKYGGTDTSRIVKKELALDVVSDAEADAYKGVYTGSDWTDMGQVAIDNGGSGDIPDQYDGHFTKRGGTKRKILEMRGEIARDLGMRTYQTMNLLTLSEIGKENVSGDTIIDLWGNPLIYIAHSTRGVKYRKPWTWGGEQAIPIGSAPGGRIEVDDRNQDGVIDDKDWIVEPSVNKKGDWNKDGSVDVKDWDSMLYNARPSNGRGVYIASAGEDGLFNCLRTQEVNADNIENKLEGE